MKVLFWKSPTAGLCLVIIFAGHEACVAIAILAMILIRIGANHLDAAHMPLALDHAKQCVGELIWRELARFDGPAGLLVVMPVFAPAVAELLVWVAGDGFRACWACAGHDVCSIIVFAPAAHA
jgi:hypothetical protein